MCKATLLEMLGKLNDQLDTDRLKSPLSC